MKKIFTTTILMILAIIASGQKKANQSVFLKLSGGSVSFGTGDFLGYSFSVEASKNLIKTPSFALNKLLLGGEIIFESGAKNPISQNPSVDEFYSKTFQQVSSTILFGKISYYPFKTILNGFNIQVGPTIGYSNRSTEAKAARTIDILGQSTRQSILSFNNGFVYGYRISTGIEFNITKKILSGFRLDFSNNNEAEINTLAGIKLGFCL